MCELVSELYYVLYSDLSFGHLHSARCLFCHWYTYTLLKKWYYHHYFVFVHWTYFCSACFRASGEFVNFSLGKLFKKYITTQDNPLGTDAASEYGELIVLSFHPFPACVTCYRKCFPFDYLMSHNNQLEFRLNSDGEQTTPNE